MWLGADLHVGATQAMSVATVDLTFYLRLPVTTRKAYSMRLRICSCSRITGVCPPHHIEEGPQPISAVPPVSDDLLLFWPSVTTVR